MPKFIKQNFGLQLLILKVLESCIRLKEPQSAYDIQNHIYQMTDSIWKPSPGSIYPVLSMLSEANYVHVEKQDNKDCYTLTETGQKFLERILSMKLLTDTFIDSKLYESFDPGSMIFLGLNATQLVPKHFTEMIATLAEREGINPEKIQEHIFGIETEIRKERIREVIAGIEKKIQLLEFIKAKFEKQLEK